MAVVYLVSTGGTLRRQNSTLQFETNAGDRTILSAGDTDEIVVQGNIEVTHGALSLIMQHRIPTVFLAYNGRFNGKVVFGPEKNVAVRVQQVRCLDSERFRLRWAREVALGKINNQLAFLQRMRRSGDVAEKTQGVAPKTLRGQMVSIETAESVEAVRGHEGFSAKTYFSVFGVHIKPDWAEFRGRSMNPPRDNVNAVLSFLYTLLRYRVEAAILKAGLDPYIGYFHRVDFGQEALVYDLMEEFRVPLGDMPTAALFNLGILGEEDFRRTDVDVLSDDDGSRTDEADAEDEGHEGFDRASAVLLTKEGLRKVIGRFEERLTGEVFYEPAGKRLSLLRIIDRQIQHARRVIMNQEDYYRAFRMK